MLVIKVKNDSCLSHAGIISHIQKDWTKTLALEAETAITKLPVIGQDYIRFQVAHNIKLLYKQCNKNKGYNTKHANIE
jgi:hypothetical protein